MPTPRPAEAGMVWAIRSVPVRSRDGPERLDQAYRRLLGNPPCAAIPDHRCIDPPRKDTAMRVAIYARVSTERQERQQTIDSQLDALRGWAASNRHLLDEAHVFRDEGYSGARLDRPGLDALRDAVRDGAVELVAVLSPDRLARRYAYQVLLLEEFRRAGCEVAFLHHPISEDPNDQLLLQIQGAIAEYERAVLGERFRRGKLQKARDGRYITGRAPYGYRYVPRRDDAPGQLLVDERRGRAGAHALRLAHRRADDHPPDPQAAERRPLPAALGPPCLVAVDGAPHPRRPDLRRHGLRQPLHLRAGRQAPRRGAQRSPRSGEATCRRLKPREQWIAVPVPALVDAETWDRAQAQLARNAALSFRNNSEVQLSAALPAHLRRPAAWPCSASPVRLRRACRERQLLRVPRQGLHPERPHLGLPEPRHQGRGD